MSTASSSRRRPSLNRGKPSSINPSSFAAMAGPSVASSLLLNPAASSNSQSDDILTNYIKYIYHYEDIYNKFNLYNTTRDGDYKKVIKNEIIRLLNTNTPPINFDNLRNLMIDGKLFLLVEESGHYKILQPVLSNKEKLEYLYRNNHYPYGEYKDDDISKTFLVQLIHSYERCMRLVSKTTISDKDLLDRYYNLALKVDNVELVPKNVIEYVKQLPTSSSTAAAGEGWTAWALRHVTKLNPLRSDKGPGTGGKRTRRHHQTKRHAKRPQSTRRKNNK